METKRNYIICTGSEYENPNNGGDECDYYELGVHEYRFSGTLEQAKKKGIELANQREENDHRYPYAISVHYWIKDEDGHFYE